MADDPGTRSIVDMALGAATTVAFAFGPVGLGIAAAIAEGKFLFDLLYATNWLTDPMQQAPDKADLQTGLNNLRDQLDDDIFDDFTKTYQVALFAASDAPKNAIRAAGVAPKAGLTMPGPTVVWSGAQSDALWQPVTDNPDIFAKLMEWVELNPSHKFATAPLDALTVGLNLLYLKTALVWEVKENLRDYEKRKASWDAARALYATQMATWSAQGSNPATMPVKPTDPAPQLPTGGDIALGSEVRDAQGLIIDAKSHLGKVSSKWAIATRDLLTDTDASGNPTGPIAWMDKMLADFDAAMAAKNTAISTPLGLVTDMALPAVSPAIVSWFDPRLGTFGTPLAHQRFQWLQRDIWREGLAGNMDHALMKAASVDKLTADDVSQLRQTVAQWRATLKMYRDALKTLEDGPLNPSNT